MNIKRKHVNYTLVIIITIAVLILFSVIMSNESFNLFVNNSVGENGIGFFFILITICNILIVPISPDIIIAMTPALFPNDEFLIVLLIILSPIISSSVCMYLGRLLGPMALEKISSKKFSNYAQEKVNKYGVISIVLSTITPLPFSGVCWACGILGVSYYSVILTVILTRIPRHLFFYYFGNMLINLV